MVNGITKQGVDSRYQIEYIYSELTENRVCGPQYPQKEFIVNTSEEAEAKREVWIHIDRERYKSPDPTTGAALYALGKVGAHRELFREVDGDREDALVPRDESTIRLRLDEHFYSEKDFTIIVNGRKKVVTTKELSFKQIVALAFNPVPTGPNILFTITYEHGPHANPEGTLMEGASVKIKDEMIFNVRQTDKS